MSSGLTAALKKAEEDLKRHGRGSGKTRRMLQHALATAKMGQTVFVIGHNDAQVRELMNHLVMLEEFKYLGPNAHVSYQARDVQLPLPMGRIQFREQGHPDWSWDELRMRGYPHGTPNYIDHYACEQLYLELQKKESKK